MHTYYLFILCYFSGNFARASEGGVMVTITLVITISYNEPVPVREILPPVCTTFAEERQRKWIAGNRVQIFTIKNAWLLTLHRFSQFWC